MSAVSHNKTLTMADFTGTVTVFNSTGGATSIAATDLWRPSNVNSAHDQFITLSGNTSNLSSTGPVSNIVLAGGSNITLSMATAANAATITISGGGLILSRWTDLGQVGSSNSAAITLSSASFRVFAIPNPISFTRVDLPILSVSISTTANASTFGRAISSGLVIYSNNAGTLSPIAGAFGTTTYTWASNTSNFSNISGYKNVTFPISTLLTPGEYFVGFQLSTATTTSSGTVTMNIMFNVAFNTASAFTDFGTTASASTNSWFAGVHTSTITATNQTIAQSNITVTGTALNQANVPIIFKAL